MSLLKKVANTFVNNQEFNSTGVYSIKGRKNVQEDAYFISDIIKNKQLIFVADGVGGHGHGDFASNKIVEIFKKSFSDISNYTNLKQFLFQTAQSVAAIIYQKGIDEPEYKNCGSTLSGFILYNEKFHTINIGDSRVYVYRNGTLAQLTKDHSIVQQLLDAGSINEEEARNHPKKNIMTSAIGQALSMIKIDVSDEFYLKTNDLLLCFSDGVHDYLSDNMIAALIRQNYESKDLAKIIVEAAFNNGSKDNITACFYHHR